MKKGEARGRGGKGKVSFWSEKRRVGAGGTTYQYLGRGGGIDFYPNSRKKGGVKKFAIREGGR